MQMSVTIHDILANDDHAVILHESTLTVGDRTHTGQYADVYTCGTGRSPRTGTWPSTPRPTRKLPQNSPRADTPATAVRATERPGPALRGRQCQICLFCTLS